VNGEELKTESGGPVPSRIVVSGAAVGRSCGSSFLERNAHEGDSPVQPRITLPAYRCFPESGCLGVQPKACGKFHIKLNIGARPIANKYREGKMQRTLERELKVLEIAKGEVVATGEVFAAVNSLCTVGWTGRLERG